MKAFVNHNVLGESLEFTGASGGVCNAKTANGDNRLRAGSDAFGLRRGRGRRWGRATNSQCADYSNSDSHTNSDSDSHTNPHTNPDTHANADADADAWDQLQHVRISAFERGDFGQCDQRLQCRRDG
ncbi:MAG TPA: hypothetical protein VK485_02385 [Sphingomicrobium sp.]|nr:hypothetical protein [Sphingomicrobium sp.]